MFAGNRSRLAIMQDTDKDWVRIYSPFRVDFVAWLKANIEPKYRQPVYEESGDKKLFRYWRVNKVALEDVIELCQTCFPGEEIVSDLAESTDWVSAVFDVCPEAHRGRLWKALAFCFHPDTTGLDPSIMVRINQEAQKRGVK